jgi:hypothetical protein
MRADGNQGPDRHLVCLYYSIIGFVKAGAVQTPQRVACQQQAAAVLRPTIVTISCTVSTQHCTGVSCALVQSCAPVTGSHWSLSQ